MYEDNYDLMKKIIEAGDKAMAKQMVNEMEDMDMEDHTDLEIWKLTRQFLRNTADLMDRMEKFLNKQENR